MTFPDTFYWGAATAAYQIEGAADKDGRHPSVWDHFCRLPDKVYHGHTGLVACDHYHHMQQDVDIMKSMGLKAYRFSLSWPRILPEGTGKVNPSGIGFYDKLVDSLLEACIQPFVTLFHWDFPLNLYHRGGWLNRDSIQWFAEYAQVVCEALSDRVQFWMTLNEPQVFLALGHGEGTHAPGLQLSVADQLLASHHVLLAHGSAVQVIRTHARRSPHIGWAPAGITAMPEHETPELIDAARTRTFAITKPDLWNSSWFMDPVYLGGYPEQGLQLYGKDLPKIHPGDMNIIGEPVDFCGVNLYNAVAVMGRRGDEITEVNRSVGHAVTAMGWPIDPESLYWAPRFLYERYQLPIYITENGLASTDWVSLDGFVHDQPRIDYTHRYLLALERAINDGIDVQGYFHWSLMDNFEWAEGYSKRFGLVYVDYSSSRRILKDSAQWYRQVIRTNGRCLHQHDATSEPPDRKVLPAQAKTRKSIMRTVT